MRPRRQGWPISLPTGHARCCSTPDTVTLARLLFQAKAGARGWLRGTSTCVSVAWIPAVWFGSSECSLVAAEAVIWCNRTSSLARCSCRARRDSLIAKEALQAMATPAARHRHRSRDLAAWAARVVGVGRGSSSPAGWRSSSTAPRLPGRPPNSRPGRQRVLDGLVSGPGRIAPGVTAYLAGPHGVLIGSAGVANLKTGAAMPGDARLRLNSVGKMWTAALILKLVGEGKMSLGDTVAHWLPGLLPYGNQITVRELLSMTSGMVDTNDLYANPAHYLGEIKDPAVRAHLVALARRMATSAHGISTQVWIALAAALPLSYAPGAYHYSNIGYMVVGLIAAHVDGADLATLFRTLIIDPLHLHSARYDPAPRITAPHADGYSPPRAARSGTSRAGRGPRGERRDRLRCRRRGAFPAGPDARTRTAARASHGARNPIRQAAATRATGSAS